MNKKNNFSLFSHKNLKKIKVFYEINIRKEELKNKIAQDYF